LKNLWSKK